MGIDKSGKGSMNLTNGEGMRSFLERSIGLKDGYHSLKIRLEVVLA